MRCARLMASFLFSTLVVSWGPPVVAATCNVPTTSYPTIQSAIDDLPCTEIVLAAGTYLEAAAVARSLTLGGASSSTTVIEEQVTVTSGTVVLQNLTIGVSLPTESNQFTAALSVSGGAQVTGTDLVVLQAVQHPLFKDGFETGDTLNWSTSIPVTRTAGPSDGLL